MVNLNAASCVPVVAAERPAVFRWSVFGGEEEPKCSAVVENSAPDGQEVRRRGGTIKADKTPVSFSPRSKPRRRLWKIHNRLTHLVII